MPYTGKQHRLFEGIKHGSIPPKKGLSKEKAGELASEGVKQSEKKGHDESKETAADERKEGSRTQSAEKKEGTEQSHKFNKGKRSNRKVKDPHGLGDFIDRIKGTKK